MGLEELRRNAAVREALGAPTPAAGSLPDLTPDRTESVALPRPTTAWLIADYSRVDVCIVGPGPTRMRADKSKVDLDYVWDRELQFTWFRADLSRADSLHVVVA